MTIWNTKLKGIDFSNSQFETIEIDQDSTKGLKVNTEQAAYLASYFLDIRVSY